MKYPVANSRSDIFRWRNSAYFERLSKLGSGENPNHKKASFFVFRIRIERAQPSTPNKKPAAKLRVQ